MPICRKVISEEGVVNVDGKLVQTSTGGSRVLADRTLIASTVLNMLATGSTGIGRCCLFHGSGDTDYVVDLLLNGTLYCLTF